MFCRGYEIESWSRFGQDFEALWSFLWRCWCLVEVEVDAWSRFWIWNSIKICVWTYDMNSTLGSVVPLAMFIQFNGFNESLKQELACQFWYWKTDPFYECFLYSEGDLLLDQIWESARAVPWVGMYMLVPYSMFSPFLGKFLLEYWNVLGELAIGGITSADHYAGTRAAGGDLDHIDCPIWP